MYMPLSEIEYAIIDNLADGIQSVGWLVHELHEGKRPWDTGSIITALVKLAEKQLIHYSPTPSGPHYLTPSSETIHTQVMTTSRTGETGYWITLTESGQEAWELWQQTRPR